MKKFFSFITIIVIGLTLYTPSVYAATPCSAINTVVISSTGTLSTVRMTGTLSEKFKPQDLTVVEYVKIVNPDTANKFEKSAPANITEGQTNFSIDIRDLEPGTYQYQLSNLLTQKNGSLYATPLSDRCQFSISEKNEASIRIENGGVSVSDKKAVVTIKTFGFLDNIPNGLSVRLGEALTDNNGNKQCIPSIDLTKPISVKKGDDSVQTEFNLTPGIYCVTVTGSVKIFGSDFNIQGDCAGEKQFVGRYINFCNSTFGVDMTVPPNLTTLDPEADLYGCKSEGTSIYCPLQPLPGTIDEKTKGIDVTSGFGNYLKGMIVLFMGIIGVLSVIMIVIGGIEYMSTVNIGEKEGARTKITNAIFGLLLALGSYAILNTINPNLVHLGVTVPGATVELSEGVDEPPTESINSYTDISGKTYSYAGICTQVGTTVSTTISVDGGAAKRVGWPIAKGLIWPRDNGQDISTQDPSDSSKNITITAGTERTQLESAGITVKPNTCDKVGDQCTSVYGLSQTAMQGLKKLKQNCPTCDIIVTGGTECWLHKTHGPGLQPVDLRKTDSLVKYVTSTGTKSGKDYTIGTTVFFDEDSAHYHVRRW